MYQFGIICFVPSAGRTVEVNPEADRMTAAEGPGMYVSYFHKAMLTNWL